ncbi:MAG: hypothetical protein KDD99_04210, partial [Bacteroidetes bacterium]|nr:hypothetical protein [Bacteroidota bacterium]
NNIARGMMFQPEVSTGRIMQQYGLLFRFYNDTLTFLMPGMSTVSELLNDITLNTSISSFIFTLTTSEPYFYQYTDLPIGQITEIMFDSHEVMDTEQNDQIQLKPDFIENKETPQIAQVKIHFDDLIKLSESENPIQYSIQFQARSTQWIYYFIGGNLNDQSKLAVYDKSNPQIRFEGPSPVKLPNGQDALQFSSGNHLIPFSEFPNFQFDLIDKSQKKHEKEPQEAQETIIIKGLPNPKPAYISITYMDDKSLVNSPMYVYL